MSAKYKYLPLKFPTSIRLLKIRSALIEGHVSCILEQFDDNIPEYSALSYYWGPTGPEHRRQIYLESVANTLDRASISVHETLWEFLDQRRRSSKTEVWFWTDFLCLDQGDKEERNHQVQRMGDIYEEATETISWLGCQGSSAAKRITDSTPVENLGQSLELIANLVSEKREAVENFFAKPELPNWTTIVKLRAFRFGDLELPKVSPEVVKLGHGRLVVIIQDILLLPYWTRVWIVQEVARGHATKLAFGSVEIDFDDFFLAYKCYFYYGVTKLGPSFGERTLPKEMASKFGERPTANKVALQARASVIDKDISMHQILQWSTLCQATRPVDRIYGLFGLLKFHGAGASAALESLVVDYGRHVTLVFWDVAFACRISPKGHGREGSFRDEMAIFIELLPLLADSLGCQHAFSPKSLVCYIETVEGPPLNKNMAQITSRMVSIFRRVGKGLFSEISLAHKESWTPKRYPAQILRQPIRFTLSVSFAEELAAILLEYADSNNIDELGEAHAAYIAVSLAKKKNSGSGEWTCISAHNQLKGDGMRDYNKKITLEYKVRWVDGRHGPTPDTIPHCSLADHATAPAHPEHHLCCGSSLFLDFPDPGLSLRLDLDTNEFDGGPNGALSITVFGRSM